MTKPLRYVISAGLPSAESAENQLLVISVTGLWRNLKVEQFHAEWLVSGEPTPVEVNRPKSHAANEASKARP